MRHSYATGLLEAGVDLLTISRRWPRELHHDHGLPALPSRTPDQRAEPAGLAADSPAANVPTCTGERNGESKEEGSGQRLDKLTLVEILRRGAAKFASNKMCPTVQSVLAKITVCRTHVMGGRKFRCHDCGETSSLYNSCGDRHCPGCSGSKRFDFNTRASKLLLPEASPQVVYYQVVCTLPSELSELALANQDEMADLLVGSAWKTLSNSIRQEQGYEPAAISVLHTWNQKLEAHWHVHLLVPGEGPAIDGKGPDGLDWKVAQAPPEQKNSDGHYLVDAARLKAAFRKRAIKRLRWIRKQGKLKLGGKFESLREDDAWDAFIEQLKSKNWVAFIQPPPTEQSGANEVVNYLTRYLTGGPISDYRITAADEHTVTFLAREGTRVGGERQQVPITLSLRHFLQRWCLHILPEQLTKTRYLGGWSNNSRKQYMARCRASLRQLGRIPPATDATTTAVGDGVAASPNTVDSSNDFATEPRAAEDACQATTSTCPHCGSNALALVSKTPKPSWREVFWRDGATCPTWYAQLQREDHRLYWSEMFGADNYDEYQRMLVESAEGPEPTPVPKPVTERQLFLPGLTLVHAYETIHI